MLECMAVSDGCAIDAEHVDRSYIHNQKNKTSRKRIAQGKSE